MARMEDMLSVPVQDPPYAEFSAIHLNWVKVEGGRQGGDDIALIPFSRVDDFVKGESSNPDCPANFRVESRRKRPEGSLSKPRVDAYLEYTLYVTLLVSRIFFVILSYALLKRTLELGLRIRIHGLVTCFFGTYVYINPFLVSFAN